MKIRKTRKCCLELISLESIAMFEAFPQKSSMQKRGVANISEHLRHTRNQLDMNLFDHLQSNRAKYISMSFPAKKKTPRRKKIKKKERGESHIRI